MNSYFNKILAVLVFFAMISSALCVSSFAEKGNISDIINKNRPSADSEIFNEDLYTGEMKNSDLTDKVLIKAYYLPVWEWSAKTPFEIVEILTNNDVPLSYVVIDELPYFAEVTRKGEIKRHDFYKRTPSFVTDILESNVYELASVPDDVVFKDILYFETAKLPFSAVVYYISDENTVALCYDHLYGEATAFSLEDIQKYGPAYWNYLGSYENNYNEDGRPLGGNSIYFSHYVANVYNPSHDISENEVSVPALEEGSVPEMFVSESQLETSFIDPNDEPDKDKNDNRLWWMFGGVIFSIVIITAVVYIAKKK